MPRRRWLLAPRWCLESHHFSCSSHACFGSLRTYPTFSCGTAVALAAQKPLAKVQRSRNESRFNGSEIHDHCVFGIAGFWGPPSHKLIPIGIGGVTDPENDRVAIKVLNVSQDEPVRSTGHGDTSPDAVILEESFLLRAERSGGGNGRVYRILFSAADAQGGTCTGSVEATVPHSMKPGISAVDDGALYDSTAH